MGGVPQLLPLGVVVGGVSHPYHSSPPLPTPPLPFLAVAVGLVGLVVGLATIPATLAMSVPFLWIVWQGRCLLLLLLLLQW